MDGASHYREAEEYLEAAMETSHTESEASLLSYAQVHATLALAAATVLKTAEAYYEINDDIEAWAEATDVRAVHEDQDDDNRRPIVDVHLPELADSREG